VPRVACAEQTQFSIFSYSILGAGKGMVHIRCGTLALF